MLVEPEVVKTKFLGEFYLADLLPEQIDVGDAITGIGWRPDCKSHIALVSFVSRVADYFRLTRKRIVRRITPASSQPLSPLLQTAHSVS